MKVGPLVRRPVLTIQPHQSVEAAAQMMAQHGVHGLVVVDAHDHLLGIITTTDIIGAALGGRKDDSAQASSVAPAEPARHMLTLTACRWRSVTV
jgi:CBS domain-containing protein